MHELLPSLCELCYPPLVQVKSPSWAEAENSCQESSCIPKLTSSPSASNLPQASYMCIHTKLQLLETFICAISMIRGDAGQGNEAGEVLKREILTAPAPCLRLAHRCRATFCAAGQTGPAGRVSISCIYAQACVPVHPRIHTSSV